MGACYRGLFPGVLSEIGELSINYSSVEKAISYFTVTGVSKRVLQFVCIDQLLSNVVKCNLS